MQFLTRAQSSQLTCGAGKIYSKKQVMYHTRNPLNKKTEPLFLDSGTFSITMTELCALKSKLFTFASGVANNFASTFY